MAHEVHTPTASARLHTEAVALATDMTAMLLEYRDRVGSDESFGLATEVLTLSAHILKSRRSVTIRKSREHLAQARIVCMRALVAMERFAAQSDIPFLRSADIHLRMSRLARALGAASDTRAWDSTGARPTRTGALFTPAKRSK